MSHPEFDFMDPARARRTDPETSRKAAESLDKDRVTALQAKALLALEALGGSGINDEIVRVSGEPWKSITPRMKPLRRNGYVVAAGERKAGSGRSQTIWSLTVKGQSFVRTKGGVA